MTDGTSQGLFIVVAIVIFGIFVVMAYILFEDTLSPAMANMFTTATEQANDRLVFKGDLLGTNSVNDSAFRSRLGTRAGATYKIDTTEKYGNHNSIKITFNGEGRDFLYKDDFVIYLNRKYNDKMAIGDKVQVSFYAKSETDVVLGSRLGGLWLKHSLGESDETPLTSEWKHYSMEYTIEHMESNMETQPAIVLWTEEPANVWIHDVRVKLSY